MQDLSGEPGFGSGLRIQTESCCVILYMCIGRASLEGDLFREGPLGNIKVGVVVHRVAVILQTFKVSAFLHGSARPCPSPPKQSGLGVWGCTLRVGLGAELVPGTAGPSDTQTLWFQVD